MSSGSARFTEKFWGGARRRRDRARPPLIWIADMDVSKTRTASVGGSSRFEWLDLARLFAVGAVIIYHFAWRGAMADDHLTNAVLPQLSSFSIYGYFGVKLFFVISGFVISFSAADRTVLTFAIARFARIYPTFLLCMTVTFLVTLVLGGGVFNASLGKWAANATFLPAMAVQKLTMDGAYWSIYAEVVFYAWIAALLAAGWFDKKLLLVVLLWLLLSAVGEALGSPLALRRLFLIDNSGFFAAGIVIFVLARDGFSWEAVLALAAATACASMQALREGAIMRDYLHAPIRPNVLLALTFGSVLLVGAAARWRAAPFPRAFVLAVGGLTYPLYLLHQNIGYMIFNRLGAHFSPEAMVAAVILFLVVLSWLVWRYFDRSAQRYASRTLTALAARHAPGGRLASTGLRAE
jgi:peptidoglycan/LPS O-acetylase OafA/YrhL